MAIDAEEFENSRNQERIKWRLPRRRPGGFVKWIAEPLTFRKGPPDAAHFPAKAEVVVESLEFVGVGNNDPSKAQSERDHHHPKKRSAGLSPPAVET